MSFSKRDPILFKAAQRHVAFRGRCDAVARNGIHTS
jgi:hypothetical protein